MSYKTGQLYLLLTGQGEKPKTEIDFAWDSLKNKGRRDDQDFQMGFSSGRPNLLEQRPYMTKNTKNKKLAN